MMAQAGHNYTASHYPGVAWGVAVHHYGSFSILPLNATVSCKLQTNSVTVSNADSSAWCFSLSADGTAAPTLIAPGASANIAGAESNIEVFLGLDPSQQICSEHFITIGCN